MLLKNLLVVTHLIAMAVAVGRMLEFDLYFLRSAHQPLNSAMRRALRHTQRTMTLTLAVLWVSGIALVAMAAAQQPQVLQNEKLWVKVLTVVCLTLNGFVLHRVAFPLLTGERAFLDLPARQRLGLTLCAVMSSVSWLYVSFLGIARSWNDTAPFGHVLGVYLALLAAAGLGAAGLLGLLAASRRADAPHTRFADTITRFPPNA